MTDERIDKERARAEKEYRAQWIRDAARDLLIARFGTDEANRAVFYQVGCPPPHIDVLEHPEVPAWRFASALWDLYVKERE